MGDLTSHSFPTIVAKKVGVMEAIILQHIYFWWKENSVNNRNKHDGKYWTYNSYASFGKIFYYLSQSQIKRIITKLEFDGYIESSNYNTLSIDRTKWYTITDRTYSLFNHTGQRMDEIVPPSERNSQPTERNSQPSEQNSQPLPDINSNINSNINSDKYKGSQIKNLQGDNLNDIDNLDFDKKEPLKKKIKKGEIEAKKIVEIFNDVCINLPKVHKITDERIKAINKLLKEYTLSEIGKVIENTANSDYLNGRIKKWRASFDWLIKPANFIKVLEGNYINKENKGEDLGQWMNNLYNDLETVKY